VQPLELLDDRPDAHEQEAPALLPASAELGEGIDRELDVAGVGVRMAEEPLLEHVEPDHRPLQGGLGEGPVVVEAQVALQPQELGPHRP